MSSLITNATIQIRKDTAGNWTSNNPTPAAGEWCKETDTGNLKQGDGSTAWTALGYYISLPETYNIASANTVIALPDITGSVQRKTYYWTAGDGSNTFSFTVSDASTIGGVAATLWIGEGAGHISIESDGTNWQVREYEDSGSNANGNWKKFLDGELRCKFSDTNTIITTTALGSIFINSASYTFPHIFIDTSIIILKSTTLVIGRVWPGPESGLTTSSFTFWILGAQITNSGKTSYEAIGKWRT